VLSRPETIRMMQEAHAEAFHQGAGHIVQDLHLSARTWNFEVEAIRCRTTIHVGADDSQVPPAAGKWLATQIPNARLREYPRQGHYVHYAAAREILQGIVIP
jgi:pimeloyl-ACP methyl ester carboxylesterase